MKANIRLTYLHLKCFYQLAKTIIGILSQFKNNYVGPRSAGISITNKPRALSNARELSVFLLPSPHFGVRMISIWIAFSHHGTLLSRNSPGSSSPGRSVATIAVEAGTSFGPG